MFLVPRERPGRLEKRANPLTSERPSIDGMLAIDGPFSRALERYEQRAEQREMMEAVERSIEEGGRLIVEAGTGTGKSLGYLTPAAIHAVECGEPVVVSTATIALQDQLINKDIPALVAAAKASAAAGDESGLARIAGLKATVLKGRSNYLCLRRWFIANRQPPSEPVEAELHAKVIAWLHTTESGDRAELRLSPDQQRYWLRLSEEEGACIPGQCVFHRNNQCFLFRARHEAESSHIIVVNHALLLSDLLRGGSVLPAFRHLIVDEAHHLEDEATTQAGYSLSASAVRALLHRVALSSPADDTESILSTAFRSLVPVLPANSKDGPRLADAMASASEAARSALQGIESLDRLVDDVVARYSEGSAGYERRARITPGVRSDPVWSHVEIEWDQVAASISSVVEAIRVMAATIEGQSDEELPNRGSLLTDLELAESELVNLRERGMDIVTGINHQLISWVTKHQTSGDLSVHAVPLSVADILQSELYSRLESLVLTSATLSTEGSFTFIRERLGLQDAIGVQVPSPFDYEASTLIGVADDIPEPNQAGHQKMLQRALISICRASRGRAMVLFTSHSALQNSYHAVKPALEREGIQVLGQRIDGSPRQLIERLSEFPTTVLLGTNSFWEGVDIVGEALSLLVITRLPFSVPTDPVFAARSEQFESPFVQYAVPQAILRFKQGFGRLIRSSQDRGVVAILDRRVISRGYGRAFLTSLPPTNVIEGGHQYIAEWVEDWLDRARIEAKEVIS
jgi:DNA polymerase-3 subunit epsilon/ATP-dependent DNA helicase DinG